MAETLWPIAFSAASRQNMVKISIITDCLSLKYVPAFTLLVFLGPLGAGLIGTILPAFGYFPALGAEDFSLLSWRYLLDYPALPEALHLTLLSGFVATALSLSLAIAFTAAWQGRPSFNRVRKLLAPILAIPHSALAIGFAFLLAPSGWIARLFSPGVTGWDTPPDIAIIHDPFAVSLILGLVIKETPYLLLMIIAACDQGQARQRLVLAQTLGYSPVAAWIKAVLPLIYRQIRLPIYAVLAFSLSVVDVALVLGPTAPPTLPVLIVRWFNDPDLSYRALASTAAAFQLVIVVLSILVWYLLEQLMAQIFRHWLSNGQRSCAERTISFLSRSFFQILGGVFCGSLLVIAIWSFTRRWRYPDAFPSEWSIQSWQNNLDTLLLSSSTTLIVGSISALIAVILSVACLENEKRRGKTAGSGALWLLYLPLMIPQVSFLFGTQVIAIKLDIDGSWLALIWSHLLFVLPYVFLSLAEPYRFQDNRFVNIAHCLGASPWRAFWKVRLPMLLRPLLFALAIGFAVSVAQYLPTLFAGGGRFMTLTTEAVNLSASGNRRIISVYALLQGLFPLLAFSAAIGFSNFTFRHRKALSQS
ncbi:ABC transporter permease subunit [Kiloniella laminariae]|uniref:ABC transporter permease subunit n=1 Tax=Kiloniella laminariae TaxID=454162 RepID=A0ABT4LME4_9PROT|nr:ABC transporter permease subunit [Kiloniella laminariae]MCZ4282231.1 ABC transporter permease subunit [Kiloniella laminariae]